MHAKLVSIKSRSGLEGNLQGISYNSDNFLRGPMMTERNGSQNRLIHNLFININMRIPVVLHF